MCRPRPGLGHGGGLLGLGCGGGDTGLVLLDGNFNKYKKPKKRRWLNF
jgi:hypothetical protein